jgi:hypothetical protein
MQCLSRGWRSAPVLGRSKVRMPGEDARLHGWREACRYIKQPIPDEECGRLFPGARSVVPGPQFRS